MNEWTAAVWASISALMAALILGMIAVLGSLARESATVQHTDDNAVAIVKEIRRFSPYNNTTNLYPQDVISAIAEFKGMPAVWVDTLAGTGVNFAWQWTESTSSSQYTTSYLTGIFPADGLYDASLVSDANGAVIRIEFRRH